MSARTRALAVSIASAIALTAVAVALAGSIATGSATTAPALACSGVSVAPGANVQNVLNAYGTGTTFCFQPGTYVLSGYVIPRSYDKLISVVPRGAVFTGNDVSNAGVRGYGGSTGQHDVLFKGFVVSHMANSTISALSLGNNWDAENNEIAYNSQVGVALNSGDVVNGNFIHHNGRYGFTGGAITNVRFTNNEVSYNNTAKYGISNAGGSKIFKSSYVTFRGNNVHNNYGNGLHADTDNIYFTYEYNNVHDNWGVGIFHEVSYDAVIRYNTVTNNDLRIAGESMYYGADIFLNDSQNVQIYNNTVKAGVHGIGLYDNDRGSGAHGLYQIANVYVHDNTVTLPTGGQTGLVGSRSTAYTSTAANHFVHDSYTVPNISGGDWQRNGTKTWSQWRSTGNDTTGTVVAGS